MFSKFATNSVLVLAICVLSSEGADTNLPLSREARLIEVYSPTEWMVEGIGIGRGKEKFRQEKAMLDAKKAAIWFILHGQDGLVQTEEEREKIKNCQEALFEEKTVEGFITWMNHTPRQILRIERSKALKVIVDLRVNRKKVYDWLVDNCGFAPLPANPPSVMVLPEVPKGTNPIEVLYTDKLLENASDIIVSFLTSQRIEAFVPKDNVNRTYEQLGIVWDIPDDYTSYFALALGADIYLTYSLEVEKRAIGSTKTNKAIVWVQAYETTTGHPIAGETGYSGNRPSPEAVVVEEAMNDAMGKVLARIDRYWKEEWAKGIQYRTIFNIERKNFDRQQLEAYTETLGNILGKLCTEVSVNLVTDVIADFLVRAKYDDFQKMSQIYKVLKESFSKEFPNAELKRVVLNRRLLVAKVTCAERGRHGE